MFSKVIPRDGERANTEQCNINDYETVFSFLLFQFISELVKKKKNVFQTKLLHLFILSLAFSIEIDCYRCAGDYQKFISELRIFFIYTETLTTYVSIST